MSKRDFRALMKGMLRDAVAAASQRLKPHSYREALALGRYLKESLKRSCQTPAHQS